jgi:predicted ATPase/class 3 adenylate cyclase
VQLGSERTIDPGHGSRKLPSGTVTLLFTDIENSTLLLQELGDRWPEVVQDHRRLIRAAIEAHQGIVVDTEGDSFFIAFPSALDGATGAVAAQKALTAHTWPGFELRVRMGIHTGEPRLVGDGYLGLDVHRAARIMSAGHGGQIVLSDATASLIAKELSPGAQLRDLGEHRLKDLPRPERLYQLEVQGLPAEFPKLKSLDIRRNNLPLHLTSFVGRQEEMAAARKLLDQSRLVTLVGPGGMGKTRLALQLATELLENYADGVWLIELAPISDAELIAPRLLMVLGLREQPGRPALQTLVDYLGSRQVMLVLDNSEHLVEATAGLVSALLNACPKLRMLVTSREALNVPGEAVWRVPSLSLPEPERVLPAAELAQWPAVALFVDRGAAALPSFQLSENNATLVAQVCRRLDGIPLAIELAAARLKVLSVQQLADRLSDRFRVLAGGSRTALPRQQTLRAAIDWSHDLLDQREKVLLRRIAVFAGGFNLEAAEAVCGRDPLDTGEVLDLVSALVSKSLLTPEERGGEPRYRALETIRDYAAERLREAGELAALERAHREWFLGQAERAETEFRSSEQFLWFDRLELELGNLRASFKSCLDNGESDSALRYAAALGLFWRARGHLTEGRDWFRRALSRREFSDPRVHAKALAWAGYLAIPQGAFEEAELLAEESLAIYRGLSDTWGIGFALQVLGSVALNQDDYARALDFAQRSLPYYKESGDWSGLGFSHLYLAMVARQKARYAEALSLLEEAVTLFRRVGDKRGIAIALRIMGGVEISQGHYAPATALLQESLELAREAKDKVDVYTIVHLLGRAARCVGDYPRATELFREMHTLARELNITLGVGSALAELGTVARLEGDLEGATHLIIEALAVLDSGHKVGIAWALHALAMVFGAQRRWSEATRLLAAADALRQEMGTPLPVFEQGERDSARQILRSKLSEEEFSRLWAQGRALALDDVRALARELAPDESPRGRII